MLRYDVEGPVATLTINDPDRRNPLSGEVMEAMHESLRRAISDSDVRVIVITGQGEKAFSAGGDLSGGFFDDPIGLHSTRGLISDVFRLMRTGGKPTIARVNGHALAGGFGLAAACDIVVAVEWAKMGTTEMRVGLWPMQISAILMRVMAPRLALELMMTGEVFLASRAMQLGVVSKVVDSMAVLDEAVSEYVDRLLAVSPAAMELGRDSFYRVQDMGLDRALDYLQSGLTALTLTEDAREGVSAFVERRPAVWKGR